MGVDLRIRNDNEKSTGTQVRPGDIHSVVPTVGHVKACLWSYDDDHYETTCGDAFWFESDGPVENGFLFCPYCGLRLHEGATLTNTEE